MLLSAVLFMVWCRKLTLNRTASSAAQEIVILVKGLGVASRTSERLAKPRHLYSVGFLHENCSFLVVPDTLQARRCSEDNSCYADAIRSDPIDEM